MNDHSRFSPSSANRWMNCQQSLAPIPSEFSIPREETTYSRDGTAKHKLAEWAFHNNQDPADALLMELSFAGLQVTTSMVEAADVYVNAIKSITDKYPDAHIEFETRVHMPDINDEMYGTADCRIFVERIGHLFIVDAKFGWEIVEAVQNWQLRLYGAGSIRDYEDLGYEVKTVTLAVVQPEDRFEPVKIDVLPREAFKGLIREVKKAMRGNALKAGDWCKYCPRAQVPGLCPELERIALETVEEAEAARQAVTVDHHVSTYDPQRLATLLDQQEVVKIFFAAVANWTKHSILLGAKVPGWKVGDAEGNRYYRDPNKAEKVLLSEFGEGIYEPRTLRSPAQIEKIWPRAKVLMNGTKEEAGLTARDRTGLKLKRDVG